MIPSDFHFYIKQKLFDGLFGSSFPFNSKFKPIFIFEFKSNVLLPVFGCNFFESLVELYPFETPDDTELSVIPNMVCSVWVNSGMFRNTERELWKYFGTRSPELKNK
jgi:hypothetical protein